MNTDVRTRVHRQWRWYAAATLAEVATSFGFSVYFYLRYGLHTPVALEPQVVSAFFAAFSYFAVDHNEDKPHAWPLNTARLAVGSVLMMFVAGGFAVSTSVKDLSPIIPALVALGVVCVVAMLVAGWAKRRALTDVGHREIIDGNLAARFEMRDNHAVFIVDNQRATLLCSVRTARYDKRTETWRPRGSLVGGDRKRTACSIGDIRDPRATYLRVPQRIALPGRLHRRTFLELSVGPALVFDTPEGRWIISTNRAQDAYEVVADKCAKFRRSAPGLPLGNFLPKNL
jgi:hypothetical protein